MCVHVCVCVSVCEGVSVSMRVRFYSLLFPISDIAGCASDSSLAFLTMFRQSSRFSKF